MEEVKNKATEEKTEAFAYIKKVNSLTSADNKESFGALNGKYRDTLRKIDSVFVMLKKRTAEKERVKREEEEKAKAAVKVVETEKVEVKPAPVVAPAPEVKPENVEVKPVPEK